MRLLCSIALALAVCAQPPTDKEKRVEKKVTGDFRVKLTPVTEPASPLGRMLIDKHFEGPLTGHSEGFMIAFMTEVKGSAGYVAMEKVTGSLDGRAGSFVLQHSSTMERGAPHQSVTVVPDSGTGALMGLKGSMTIRIEGGKHFYDFSYSLP